MVHDLFDGAQVEPRMPESMHAWMKALRDPAEALLEPEHARRVDGDQGQRLVLAQPAVLDGLGRLGVEAPRELGQDDAGGVLAAVVDDDDFVIHSKAAARLEGRKRGAFNVRLLVVAREKNRERFWYRLTI